MMWGLGGADADSDQAKQSLNLAIGSVDHISQALRCEGHICFKVDVYHLIHIICFTIYETVSSILYVVRYRKLLCDDVNSYFCTYYVARYISIFVIYYARYYSK